MTSFPIGSSVLLQNLVKAHLNDKKGIVKSKLSSTGRQEVYIFEENKSLAIKPTNLKYEPRTLSSLSIPEMKSILTNGIGSSNSIDFTGLDKDSLRTMVIDEIKDVDDTIEIAKLVAKANEPKNIPTTNSTMNGSGGVGGQQQFSSSQLRQGAERMSSMSAEDIKRQAQTMKAMGPAALRNMNPQFASMSDEQINMAITQMEAVANNPSQLQMAAQQMKNMSESELDQAVKQTGFNGGDAAAGGSAATSTAAASSPNALPNISKSQMQQATSQLQNMTPEQLKQQAAMLKSMSNDQLRATNPQMANMTDSQIQMSIQQLEMMANNPAMVKMAADQMKNMNENDFENMRKSLDPNMSNVFGGGSINNGTAANSSEAAPPNLADMQSNMSSLLTNPEQLNTIVKTMKASPDMLKSTLGPMINNGSEAQQKQMNDAIDSFVQMDDAKLEKYLKLANGLQRVATPFVNTFGKVKDMTGLSAKALFGLWNLMVFVSFVGAVRWWMSRNGVDDDVVGVDDVLGRSHEEEMPDMSGVADEF